MRESLGILTAIALLLAGCGSVQQDGTSSPTTALPADAAPDHSAIEDTPAALEMVLPSHGVDVAPSAPSAPPIPASSSLRLYQPSPAAPIGQFAAPIQSGPITGYGPGGMAHEPGMPANPPWSYGIGR